MASAEFTPDGGCFVEIGGVQVRALGLSWDAGEGVLYAALPAEGAKVFADDDTVRLGAVHPEPSTDQMVDIIATLNPLILTGLMHEELRDSSMDDPIGLIAKRAIQRALRGETPDQPGGGQEFSLDGPLH